MISGDDLRTARLSCGLSLGQLGRLIGRDKGHLSRVETGHGRQVTPALLHAYEQALGVKIVAASSEDPAPSDETAEARTLSALREVSAVGSGETEADLLIVRGTSTAELISRFTKEDLAYDRREAARSLVAILFGAALLERAEGWLFAAEPSLTPRRTAGIGYQEIEQIEQGARLFRSWDNQFGGGLRRKAVIGQLTEVADELRDFSHPAELTRRLHGAMAQLAATAATMSWDSGQGGVAQRYYLLALRAAKAADDPAFCANILAGMARQQYYLGRVSEGLELVRLAQDGTGRRLTPAVLGMLHTREAWAYAKQGRLGAFRRATGYAEDRLRDADPTVEPYWISYFDQAELAGVTGGRLLEIAYQAPEHADEAATWLGQAVALRDRHSLRSAALDQLGFAEVRLIQGEYDEAARLGHEAVNTVEQTQSTRVRVKLAEFYRHAGSTTATGTIAALRSRIEPILRAAPAA
ncbi:helix-turn-helix transcriptional regulator [Pseudofrankia sp. DC12]|uniref:helix-turn-helix domain-containing protein n=1 Tax=Pseudofrankia sp. DC12 TaxID=683315 RepID=UPI000A78EDE2|nr:helix-turn-helix transcriptional regulator [Pseudofrankia sp. DC12]